MLILWYDRGKVVEGSTLWKPLFLYLVCDKFVLAQIRYLPCIVVEAYRALQYYSRPSSALILYKVNFNMQCMCGLESVKENT